MSEASRWAGLDAARGLAIVAMVAFHVIWDLGHFGYVDPDFPFSAGVKAFGHAIAIAFLFIAGVSLVLAHKRGLRWPAFWRRFAIVAGAAALVSAGTYVMFPKSYVFFGILHCIAASSLLAVPFLFAPWPLTLAAAALAGAAPLVFSNAIFDAPALQWVGLSTITVLTNDYRPLLPWSGALLVGVAAMRARALAGPPSTEDRSTAFGRALGFLGRHSLVIYLAHQPLLFASFAAVSLVAPGVDQAASFVAACETQCMATGAPQSACHAGCVCTEAEATRGGALAGITDAAERGRRLNDIARACARRK